MFRHFFLKGGHLELNDSYEFFEGLEAVVGGAKVDDKTAIGAHLGRTRGLFNHL